MDVFPPKSSMYLVLQVKVHLNCQGWKSGRKSATAVQQGAKQVWFSSVFSKFWVSKLLSIYLIMAKVWGGNILTPAVVLVFRRVWLEVRTALAGLCLLWAHWRSLLFAGKTAQNNTCSYMPYRPVTLRTDVVLGQNIWGKLHGPASVPRTTLTCRFSHSHVHLGTSKAARDTQQPFASLSVDVKLTSHQQGAHLNVSTQWKIWSRFIKI